MALFSILGPRFPFIKGIAPAQPVLGNSNYVPPSVGQVSAADYASSTPSPEVGNAANAGSSVLPMVFALAQVEIELQQMMKSMRERRDTQHLQSTQQIAENLQKAQQLLAEAQQQHAATNQVLQQSLQLPFQPRKIEPMQMLEKMYNLENPWEVGGDVNNPPALLKDIEEESNNIFYIDEQGKVIGKGNKKTGWKSKYLLYRC